ncbi:MAG: NADH-quinone oxidoreductase subunit N [Bacteroidota bacterium]
MYDSLFSDSLAVLPVWVLGLTALALVLIDAFRPNAANATDAGPLIPWLTVAALAVALGIEVLRMGGDAVGVFADHLRVGGYAAFANAVVLLGALASTVLSIPYLRRTGHSLAEVYVLILIATIGMMTLAGSGSLVTAFVGLETMSVCLYVLTGLVRERERGPESALKYFLLGAFSTGFFLYGIALMYGATGTMMLSAMPEALAATGSYGLFVGGVALLLVGFLFKVSAVPFHMWTPDVYQGAPTTLTAFMSTASKTAAFAALIVVLWQAIPAGTNATLVLAVVSALTMVGGNVLALNQTNVKRMLAYSSVAHAGYILAGLAAANATGYGGALYYLLAYTVMNLGAFGVLAALEHDDAHGAVQSLDDLRGAAYRRPLLGATMGVFMFGLTGFPPLAGFIGKYQVFAGVVEANMAWLAVIGVLASAASAFYYLRVVGVLYARADKDAAIAPGVPLAAPPVLTAVVLVLCAVALLGLGLLPGGVLEATRAFFEGGAAVAVAP